MHFHIEIEIELLPATLTLWPLISRAGDTNPLNQCLLPIDIYMSMLLPTSEPDSDEWIIRLESDMHWLNRYKKTKAITRNQEQ